MLSDCFIPKLAVAITFFYIEEKLPFFEKVCSEIPSLCDNIQLHVITNANKNQKKYISRIINKYLKTKFIHIPSLVGHDFLYTWSHFSIFRRLFENDKEISHFLYLEDDLCLKKNNIYYWIKGRSFLKKYKLYPSFLRYELNSTKDGKFLVDITMSYDSKKLPSICVENDYCFVNFPQPYQGMYLMDREMMYEFFNGIYCNPDFGVWGIREKATQGLTFANIPNGLFSRNLVGYNLKYKSIDENCLVHHLPNNYSNSSSSIFGKILVEKAIRTF